MKRTVIDITKYKMKTTSNPENDIEYTFSNIDKENKLIWIDWIDKYKVEQSVSYPISDVIKYLKNKDWIVYK